MKTETHRHSSFNLTTKKKKAVWYRLDNAATIYSLINSKKSPCLFRMSCTLKQDIDLELLQTALDNILPRFPYFQVQLRPGLFWHYWETNNGSPKIMPDSKYPNGFMPIHKRRIFPFRVRVFERRIAVEFHHSLTDGTGAYTFLKALLLEYFKLIGYSFSDTGDIFTPEQTPHLEEFEDAYKRFYNKKLPTPKKPSQGFQTPLKLDKVNKYHVTTGITSVKKVLSIARELNVTITELFGAVYLEVMQDILYTIPKKKRKRHMKPIRIPIPVNLRNLFPSKTMRNFAYMISLEIDPRLGKYSFDELLRLVHHTMKKDINTKKIRQQFSRNVKGEKILLLRLAPLFIKKLLGKPIYQSFGERAYSGKLSNLGKVVLPEELAELIAGFNFSLAKSRTITNGIGVISFKDNLYITFGRTTKSAEVERRFFRKLVKLGIPIKIEKH